MEYHRQRSEYFEQLLLAKTAVVKDDVEAEQLINFPTIHRMSSISSLRREASRIVMQKKETLTEAEAKFEEAVSQR